MFYYVVNNIPVAKAKKDILAIPNAQVVEIDQDIDNFDYCVYDPNANTLKVDENLKAKKEQQEVEYLKYKKIEELKKLRDKKIDDLIVRISKGINLNANDRSQEKFKNAILILNDDESMEWVDYANNTVKLTKADFIEALKLATTEETKIVVAYNKKRDEINNCKTKEEIENTDLDF